ncbi:MAG: sn-glycerol-3-phosphate ABC transporter ATP-binding protein UgpC [Chloroflexota bacterium]|nr:sn-glycerol-3-phosphate ABC transporter ATP-binding protein UgpC [Chloroflexota bacterium]
MARVRFEHIYKHFGTVEVVRDINLEVEDQEFLVLVGPSGCGKSTLLRMVAGLEEANEGNIFIGDRLVNGVDPKDRDIAMVFQNYALYPHMNVFDNMAFSLKLHHVAKPDIKKRVEDAAEVLGLQLLLKRKPKELSGGQRQRVALGRSIVREAQVSLMDEPLSNLDAKLRVQMRAEIIKLHRLVHSTVIYVTHDQVEAMTMGDRIVVLNAGIIQQIGTPQDLYDHPANLFVAGFIGSPAMNFFHDVRVTTEGGAPLVVIDGLGQIEVPSQLADKAMQVTDKNLILGIRPEHLSDMAFAEPGLNGKSSIQAPVEVVEHLGNELLVYLASGNGKGTGTDTAMITAASSATATVTTTDDEDKQPIIARLDPRSHPKPEQVIQLHVDNNQMHLFDTETGQTIF